MCAGGSALTNPCGGGLLYSELLKEVPGRVRWLIPVVCGNDFYKRRRIVEFDPAWQVALEELCTLAKEKAQYTQFILGASAKTWKYTTWMSQEQWALYDSHVQKLCSVVESCGCVACTGAAELGMLGGLVIGDSIGHVSVRSEGLLFDSFCAWVINVVLWVEGLGAVDEGVEWPEQIEEVDDEAEQVVVKRELCEEVAQIPSVEGRAYGFVPMGRGEFSDYEGLLRSNSVLVDAPEEFEEALADEFFWVGLSWHAIAICVRVQMQLWLDDGWLVPARLRRGMPERAMRKHEEGCARCESSDSLVEVLLSGRYASQLKSVSRATCSVCGFVGETCRKNWLKGEARKQDRRVFCAVCLQAEYNLEHAYRVVSDCVLGKGAFGVVRRGFHVGCFESCAVKAVGLNDAAREELELQEALQHPNVCRVFDSIESRSMMHLALEFCDAGDLKAVMKEAPTGLLAMDEVRGFLGDLLDAVSYMHSYGLVHRDIKPANLLLKEELWEARPVLKLADFGLAARCVQGGCLKGWGTVPYMSPEQLLGYCNEYCDMWACGCVFAEMLLGEILVPQACWGDNSKALKHLRSGGVEAKLDLAFLRVVCEEGGAELLQQLFMFEWSSRLDAEDALASPFFKGRRVRAGKAVNVAYGGACDDCKGPPQFVPSPWLPQWSEEHAAWCYKRAGRNGCFHSTFECRPSCIQCGKCAGVRSSSVSGSSTFSRARECMRFRGSDGLPVLFSETSWSFQFLLLLVVTTVVVVALLLTRASLFCSLKSLWLLEKWIAVTPRVMLDARAAMPARKKVTCPVRQYRTWFHPGRCTGARSV